MELTMETVAALHDNQEFFPSGGLKFIGINEGVEKDADGGQPAEMEFPDTTYDVPDQSNDMKRDTKLRYSWIFMFYYFLPLGDIISDAIITGIVSTLQEIFIIMKM